MPSTLHIVGGVVLSFILVCQKAESQDVVAASSTHAKHCNSTTDCSANEECRLPMGHIRKKKA